MVQLNSFTGGITGTCKHCCIFYEKISPDIQM